MKRRILTALPLVFAMMLATTGRAQLVAGTDAQPVFKIGGKMTTVGDLIKEDKGVFYNVEKQKYEMLESMANDRYLKWFWEKKAKETGKSTSQAEEEYLSKNTRVSAKEVKDMLAKVKDHPQLKDRSDAEKEKMIRDHLGGKAKGEAIQGILTAARKRGELVMMYPEPVFEIVIKSTDPVRYGPKPGDTKPMGCEGNACPITLVEYSEYQCPFCSRVTPALERLLTEYKGKIRHIVRDFPLEFHDQARPAAVAARCAQDQGKFWFMYKGLFEKQQSLGQETYETVAKNIGLDMAKFKDCMKNPDAKLAIVDANQQSGMKAGVTGTPCYFVNGQRLSGALPFEDFKRAADAELAKAKR